MNQKGFSLVGVLAAVAAAGVLAMTLMQLAQLSSQINAMSEEGPEIQSQLYIAQRILSDPLTCQLNFAGSDLSNERTVIQRAPLQKQTGGSTLGTQPVFPVPVGAKNPAMGYSFSRISGTSNVVMFNIEFGRNKAVFKDQTQIRGIPMSVTLDATNRIVTCTTGSSGGGGSTDQSSLAHAQEGACGKLGIPASAGPADKGAYKTFPTDIKNFCASLTYPTPDDGLEYTCADLAKYGGNPSVIGYNQSNSIADVLSRHDRDPSIAIGVAGIPITEDCRGYLSGALNPIKKLKSSGFGGLKSAAECEKMPLFPEGSTVAGKPGTSVLTNTSPYGCVGGNCAMAGSTKQVCINGRWTEI